MFTLVLTCFFFFTGSDLTGEIKGLQPALENEDLYSTELQMKTLSGHLSFDFSDDFPLEGLGQSCV